MFARGWTPSDTQRRAFYLAVGLLLVFNPFLVHQFDLGGPRYEYAAAPVEPTDGTLDFVGTVAGLFSLRRGYRQSLVGSE